MRDRDTLAHSARAGDTTMKLVLNSEKIERDDLFTFEVFLDDIELRDILVFQRMVNAEVDRRVGVMDRR